MLASRFVGTSEKSMLSMWAMQALSEVSLRSPTDTNLPLPFRSHPLRVLEPRRGDGTRRGESIVASTG